MLKIGDKIKMISRIGKYDMVGQIFEITDIVDNTYEILNSYLGYGCMSEDEFEKHFEKVEQKQWTDWIETKSGFSYRTDNVKYVKVRKDGIEVKASTHPCDTFNLAKGIAVCLQKIENKQKYFPGKITNVKFKYETGSKYIDKEVFENIKSTVEYNVDRDYLDVIFDSDFKEFSYADYVAPGIYLKKKSDTDEIVGIHIDNFSWKLFRI